VGAASAYAITLIVNWNDKKKARDRVARLRSRCVEPTLRDLEMNHALGDRSLEDMKEKDRHRDFLRRWLIREDMRFHARYGQAWEAIAGVSPVNAEALL
jgi:hypothetical protein